MQETFFNKSNGFYPTEKTQIFSLCHTHFFDHQLQTIQWDSVCQRCIFSRGAFRPAVLPDSVHGQAAFLPFNTSSLVTHVEKQKTRMKWGTGLQPNGVQLNCSVQQTESDPPRGAQSGLSCGSLGCCCVSSLQRQNACLCGLQVNCSWGTERRKSHHRKSRDYRRLNTEDYTFRLPPRNAPHANEPGFQKERERKKSRRNSFVTICSGENTSSVTKLRESAWTSSFVFFCLCEWVKACLALRLPDGM